MLKFYVTLRKSTGESQNRCVQRSLTGSVTAERCRGNENPRGNNKRTFVIILSDDFAAVDLCEEPCNNGLPEKGKLTERDEKRQRGQTIKRYGARRKIRQRFCKRVSAKRCLVAAPFVSRFFERV